MNQSQQNCLVSMSEIACRLKEECTAPSEKLYTPRRGIDNTYGWRPFLQVARSVSDEEIEDELDSWSGGASAYSIKVVLFQKDLVRRGDGYDIFYDLCLNNYWLWSLVDAAAQAALRRDCFPIDAECFVEAIDTLKRAVPQVRFACLSTTLTRVLSDCTGTMDLVERSTYLKRQVEEDDISSFAKLLKGSITKEGFQEYLDHGLILVDDDRETDPREADIRFNKLLLLDWQLGQRGPVYARHEGLEVKKNFY